MSPSKKTTGGWGRVTVSPRFGAPAGSPPHIQLIGDIGHPDFRDAVSLLRSESRPTAWLQTRPELIVIAQSRPDAFLAEEVNHLRRAAPLAGIVALLGSWCEGETRTGRPWPGVARIYWYEFPAWWRRQLQLRTAYHCPDWARAATQLPRKCVPGHPQPRPGLIVLRTPSRDNADALAEALSHANHSTTWQRHVQPRAYTRGAIAGIWDGGQLNDAEASDLAEFCTQMSREGAPVLAMLDFPRRDGVNQGYEAGAAAILGKPYLNCDLIATLESIARATKNARAA
jgi:hypothetical protein